MSYKDLLTLLQGVLEILIINMLMIKLAGDNMVFCILAAVLGVFIGYKKRDVAYRRYRGTTKKVVKGICEKDSVYMKFSIWNRALNNFWNEYRMWALIETVWFIIPVSILIKSNDLTLTLSVVHGFILLRLGDVVEWLSVRQKKSEINLYLKKTMNGGEGDVR